jgi:hypothetical protein
MSAPPTQGSPNTLAEARPCGFAPEHVYRSAAITGDRVTRFVAVFLRELFECDGLHYDAVYVAFAESGLQPLPAIQCEGPHFDSRVERLNRLADVLVESIVEDESIRAAMTALAATVLSRFTIPAHNEHLTVAELQEFLACCSRSDHEHISDYDAYAARHSHLGVCTLCEVRMQLARGSKAPVPHIHNSKKDRALRMKQMKLFWQCLRRFPPRNAAPCTD